MTDCTMLWLAWRSVRIEVRMLVCLGRQVCDDVAKESSKSGDEAHTVRQGLSNTHN